MCKEGFFIIKICCVILCHCHIHTHARIWMSPEPSLFLLCIPCFHNFAFAFNQLHCRTTYNSHHKYGVCECEIFFFTPRCVSSDKMINEFCNFFFARLWLRGKLERIRPIAKMENYFSKEANKKLQTENPHGRESSETKPYSLFLSRPE